MKYSDPYEESHVNSVFVYMAIIMSAIVIGVVAMIFWMNTPKKNNKNASVALANTQSSEVKQASKIKLQTEEMVKSVDELLSGSTLTSDQLDIWTLPDIDTDVSYDSMDTKNGTLKNQTTGETLVQGVMTENKEDNIEKTQSQDEAATTELFGEETTEEDAIEQITLTLADGTEQTVDFIDSLTRSTYDLEQFVYQKPEMKYYVDGKQSSTFGADISSKSGKVDFSKLKKAGCDFCMIRIGQRGYSSGNIVMDETYKDNLEGAKKAGLKIGAYFYSQAITKDEVLEEADSLLDVIDDYTVTYPIMFDMEAVPDDLARTDALDVATRTRLAKLFMDEIEDAGYKVILYGNLEWLLTKLDLEALSDYDICVAQDSDSPDYPYEFQMWQYKSAATINGVEEDTRLFVCLKDYE